MTHATPERPAATVLLLVKVLVFAALGLLVASLWSAAYLAPSTTTLLARLLSPAIAAIGVGVAAKGSFLDAPRSRWPFVKRATAVGVVFAAASLFAFAKSRTCS